MIEFWQNQNISLAAFRLIAIWVFGEGGALKIGDNSREHVYQKLGSTSKVCVPHFWSVFWVGSNLYYWGNFTGMGIEDPQQAHIKLFLAGGCHSRSLNFDQLLNHVVYTFGCNMVFCLFGCCKLPQPRFLIGDGFWHFSFWKKRYLRPSKSREKSDKSENLKKKK